MTNAAGRFAYVGDPTNPVDARYHGYDQWGRITDAWDGAGRHFEYSYGTDGGLNRLQSVIASAAGGGEVGRVEYDYCDSTSSNGMAGDLRLVTVRIPCTPSNVGDPAEIVQQTYYRNWGWASGQPSAIDGFSPGPQRSVRMVVGPEGMRKLQQAMSDWATRSDTDIASYATLRLGYSSSTNPAKVSLAQSEGRLEHRIELRYETSTASFTSGYDNIWATRTVALDRTGSVGSLSTYRAATFYFDEVGQPLSSIITTQDPATSASSFWTTRVARDSYGCVTTIGTPASSTAYTHSTGAITSGSSGLIKHFARMSYATNSTPIELDGFISLISHSTDWGGTGALKDNQIAYESIGGTNRPSKLLPSYRVRRPLVDTSKSFAVGDGSDAGQETSIEYHLPSSVADSSSLALTVEWMKILHPAVSSTQHGSGQANYSAVAFHPDGRISYARAVGDANASLTYFGYNLPGVTDSDDSGLIQTVVSDVNSSSPPNAGELPTGFPTGSLNPVPNVASFSYDPQGRKLASLGADGLMKMTAYRKLADGRQVIVQGIAIPDGQEPEEFVFASPGRFAVLNHNQGTEASGLLTWESLARYDRCSI